MTVQNEDGVLTQEWWYSGL